MINEKKLIEKLKKEISETYHEDCILALERAIEIVKEQPKIREWIPADQPPTEFNKFGYSEEEKPKTNGDMIRAMSDDELGILLGDLAADTYCHDCIIHKNGHNVCNGSCRDNFKDWIKQPAERGCGITNKQKTRLDYANEVSNLLENASADLSPTDFKILLCVIRDLLNIYG